jgi:hypothetical protein
MLFAPPNVKLNFAADSTPAVTGYALALGKASAPECAFTAARLVLGWAHLVKPRLTQAARLARVSDSYVGAALEVLRSDPDLGLEGAVLRGELSLFEAAVLAKHPQRSLTKLFLTASAIELADLGKRAGPAVVWDRVIIPNL